MRTKKMLLSNIATIIRTPRIPSDFISFSTVTYDDILDYQECLSLNNTLTPKLYKEKNSHKFANKAVMQREDILYPLKRQDHSPRFVNWTEDIELNLVYNGELIIVRTTDELINKKFLFLALNSPHVKDYINKLAEKFKPNRITSEMLEKLKISVPELSEQEEIIKSLEEIDQQKLKITEQFIKYIDV